MDAERSDAPLLPEGLDPGRVLEQLDAGVVCCRIEYVDGHPDDLVYLYANPAFHRLTGLSAVVGHRASESTPELMRTDPWLFEIWDRVARTGVAEKFERYVRAVDRWFDVEVTSTLPGHITAVFATRTTAEHEALERKQAPDVTPRRRAEEEFEDLYENAPVGYHSLGQDGTILRMNRTELGWLGYAADEVVGRMKAVDLLTPASCETFARQFPLMVETGMLPELRLEMRRRDGSTFPVELRATSVLDAKGRFVRTRSTVVDVSETVRAQQALRVSEARYRGVVEGQTELIVRFTVDGTVLWANEAYLRMFGLGFDQAINAKWQPLVHPEDVGRVEAGIAALTPQQPVAVIENRVRDGRGDVRWMQFVSRGFFDAAGALHEIQSVGRDITDLKALQAQLQHALHEKNSVIEALPHTIAVLDEQGVITAVNESWRCYARDNGGPDAVVDPVGTSYRRACEVSPDLPGADAARAAWDGIAAVLDGSRGRFSMVYECDTPVRRSWYQLTAVPVKTPVRGAIVSHVEVTAEREAGQRLAYERTLLHTLLQAIPDPVWLKDTEGRYVACNAALGALFGAPAAAVVGKTDADFLPPELAEAYRERDREAAVADRMFVLEQWMQYRTDGRRALFEVTMAPVRGADGTLSGVLGIAHDITERHQQAMLIENLALHDPLTRLANRRLLLDRLEHTLAACRRHGTVGALMVLDLDRFKDLNDRHGHAVGDLLLIEVGQRLRRCVRESDTVARPGGDEFVVLVTELPDEGDHGAAALALAGRIREAVGEPYRLVAAGAAGRLPIEHHCTGSIGVALIGPDDKPAADILHAADLAMYQAKAAGRNQAQLAVRAS